MSQVSATAANQPTGNTLVGNSIEDLDLDVFLDLMLTELQNQDPLNPMDNQEMLNTISQIREISANDHLSETLASVLLGQNVATATSLIGAEVEGLTDSGQRVTGAVQNVSINDGAPLLEVAVATKASAAEQEGGIEAGRYAYEVVWESDGVTFSVQAPVNTEDLGEDFQGAIRIDNLPSTGGVPRRVYRTDNTGTGEARQIGTLTNGQATSFVDTVPDSDRKGAVLSGDRQVLLYADSIEVGLNNISHIRTRE